MSGERGSTDVRTRTTQQQILAVDLGDALHPTGAVLVRRFATRGEPAEYVVEEMRVYPLDVRAQDVVRHLNALVKAREAITREPLQGVLGVTGAGQTTATLARDGIWPRRTSVSLVSIVGAGEPYPGARVLRRAELVDLIRTHGWHVEVPEGLRWRAELREAMTTWNGKTARPAATPTEEWRPSPGEGSALIVPLALALWRGGRLGGGAMSVPKGNIRTGQGLGMKVVDEHGERFEPVRPSILSMPVRREVPPVSGPVPVSPARFGVGSVLGGGVTPSADLGVTPSADLFGLAMEEYEGRRAGGSE